MERMETLAKKALLITALLAGLVWFASLGDFPVTVGSVLGTALLAAMCVNVYRVAFPHRG